MKLRYTDRARDEVVSALDWYERQRKGLGLEFLDAIGRAEAAILEHPQMYRIWHSPFRGCLVRRFPFLMLYTVESREIVVHAVFHQRQDPTSRP